MSLARSILCVCILSAVAALAATLAAAQEAKPPTAPTTSPAPTTAPGPITAPAANTHTVKKGRIAMRIDAAGTFLPASPAEVRLRPEAYKGDLKIVAAAANGAAVTKGQVILQIDPADLNRELDAARNELTTAKANHVKADSDVALGDKSDALALKMTEAAAAKGDTDLKWWEEVTGPNMIAQSELSLRQSKSFIEDQQDELDQLKKMYKTEDLTNATADIVLKRAVRQLEVSQVSFKLQEAQAKKTKEYDQPQSRKPLEFAAEQAKQALEQLKAAQAHAKITRQATSKTTQLALAAAEKKVSDLEKDLAMLSVAAPSDGVVLYGQVGESAFQPADPKTLRPTEKVAAGATVMVLFAPGLLRVGFDLPESKLTWVKPGMKARVTPVAWPELSYEGTLAPPPPVGKSAGAEQAFALNIDLSNADPRIVPGMKATVKIDAGQGEEFPLAPAAAVAAGKVKVKGNDGKEEEREVVTGRGDGTSVEIRQGLAEGDEIVLGGKS